MKRPKRLEHPISILLRPAIFSLLQPRMEQIMMVCYDKGYKDGKREMKKKLTAKKEEV